MVFMVQKLKLLNFANVINNKSFDMINFFKGFLLIFFSSVTSINANAQNCDCITLDKSQEQLYLNGDNYTLIDNALRCFKLNSIANENDSLVRIWLLEDNFPDTPTTWHVKMFQFGKRNDIPHATLYILDWRYEIDSGFQVKCIKQLKMNPEKGWIAFERNIRALNLPALYQKPLINDGFVTVDYGMFIIQFLFGRSTHSVDYTGLLGDSSKPLQIDYSKKISSLLWYVEKYFSVRLSVDSKGRDFLKSNLDSLESDEKKHIK
jgi:hypothetical protein